MVNNLQLMIEVRIGVVHIIGDFFVVACMHSCPAEYNGGLRT
jgi:hypothetical protein